MADTPKMLGKYRIIKELGRGGFGVVHLAEDTTLRDRPVALKILHPQLLVDPETVGLFRQEAGTMASLDHPHIVTVYEVGDIEGVRFIAMRYIPGRTLAQVITEDGPQPLEQVAVWLDQVASALDYAHSQEILHRDIKPGNILLDRDGRAMVTDFGLARAVSASGGSASSQGREIMSGTAKYIAPEQAKGKPVVQSDVYSLGVVLYEFLTGQVPFDDDDPFAIAIRHITEEPRSPRELRPGLPEPLELVVLQALAKQPADRFASAGEIARAYRLALEAAARQQRAKIRRNQQERAAARRTKAPQPSSGGTKGRRSWLWTVVAVALALLLVGTIVGLGLEVLIPAPEPAPALIPAPTATATSTPTPFPTATATSTPMPFPTATATSTPNPSQVRSADGMELVYVPAGEFLMGSPDDSGAPDDEKPLHRVYLDAFWIDRTEVTNTQYVQFLNALGGHKGVCESQDCISTWDENNDSHILSRAGQYDVEPGYETHPVIVVSWHGAQAYCDWAGSRLPTEAEWEKAARGTDRRTYPWGDEWSTDRANTDEANIGGTTPVGEYPDGTSPSGALNMAGNVREWVADWYDGNYYGQSPLENPQGPEAGEYRVLRGGSWNHNLNRARSAYRGGGNPGNRFSFNGFRCGMSSTSSP